MKIEAGKYYRTRDGRKVGPMRSSPWYPGLAGWGNTETSHYVDSGKVFSDGTNDPLDLIAEWTDEPEQGTLKELNVQPGGVVEFVEHPDGLRGDENGMLHFIRDGRCGVAAYEDKNPENGNEHYSLYSPAIFKIISRASQSTTPAPDVVTPQGPVRTVTRKEIVPGVYGKVRIYHDTPDQGHVCLGLVNVSYHYTASELTQTIQTLTEIRDALSS